MSFLCKEIDDALYLIEKKYATNTASHGSDITGPYWMLIEITVGAGAIWWRSEGNDVSLPGKHLFVFVPAFSWAMEYYAPRTEIHVRGLISRETLPHLRFTHPILFNSDQSLPSTHNEVSKFLNQVENFKCIATHPNPSALSTRVKRIIDSDYADGVQIQAIAKKLRTSSAVIARRFKRDFGETPNFYKKGLRITVGMYELMMGHPPAVAAQSAGYSDLGRFYKQFKSYLKQTPAEYRQKSKNAKRKRKKLGSS